MQSFTQKSPTQAHFSELFEPISLGGVFVPNRIVMGSMHTGLEETQNAAHRLSVFYKKRAEGGVGLIVTGGISPNSEGCVAEGAAILNSENQIDFHSKITSAVHEAGEKKTKIFLQILHTGRYAMHKNGVAPSEGRAPISPYKARALSEAEIENTIQDFVNTALLAQKSHYDGVEIMGSEGYLLNQFLSEITNLRKDNWGGSAENRMRIALEIVKRTKTATTKVSQLTGKPFCLLFRVSLLDLVPGGNSWEFNSMFAQELQKAGVDALNIGIGWHESRIPTIATMVPRAAFSFVAKKIKPQISVPLIVTNRFNVPQLAHKAVQEGWADLVSMARPMLADANLPNKAKSGKWESINTCIACNQACLDHIFEHKVASCLVNPSACHETETNEPIFENKNSAVKVAVIGAGPAGLSAAITAAKRGFSVSLFEKSSQIGGQFKLASKIPGKEEFNETLRYFHNQIQECNVKLSLNSNVHSKMLIEFQHVIIATGVLPREIKLENTSTNVKILSYAEAIVNPEKIGNSVAVLGAGGIGFDVCELLIGSQSSQNISEFHEEWGIDTSFQFPGGVLPKSNTLHSSLENAAKKKIYLLQRKTSKHGESLGKTTGWIHRQSIKNFGVQTLSGVEYEKISSQGLHVKVSGNAEILDVDTVIVCAGQVSQNSLYEELKNNSNSNFKSVTLIGGALLASEVDAKRAIFEGTQAALNL